VTAFKAFRRASEEFDIALERSNLVSGCCAPLLTPIFEGFHEEPKTGLSGRNPLIAADYMRKVKDTSTGFSPYFQEVLAQTGRYPVFQHSGYHSGNFYHVLQAFIAGKVCIPDSFSLAWGKQQTFRE
jgi:hypothetical protein